MTVLIVLACILLVLWLLCQLRIGATVDYSETGLVLSIKAGPFTIGILPAKEKPQKEKKPKPAKQKAVPSEEAVKPKRSIKDTVAIVLKFVPLVGQAAGHLRRKIRIDWLKLHVIWANADPASAAIGYGAGNALLGTLWPVLDNNFKIKERDLRVDVDFERTNPTVTLNARATLTIGQSLSMGIRLGIQALKIYLGIRRDSQQNTEKAVQA